MDLKEVTARLKKLVVREEFDKPKPFQCDTCTPTRPRADGKVAAMEVVQAAARKVC